MVFRNPSFRRLLFGVALALGCLFRPIAAHSETILLRGSMRTTADFTDTFTVHVPEHVPSLTIRLPIPDTISPNTDALDEQVHVGHVDVSSSLTPTSESDVRDASNNLYRVLKYANAAPQTLTITVSFEQLSASSDLGDATPNIAFPIGPVPSALDLYIKPSKLVQSDNPTIRALAQRITAPCSTEEEAASAIEQWLQGHLIYSYASADAGSDALATYRRRGAMCEGWAHLFLALARASGIPARFVGGYSLGGSITYPCSSDGQSSMTVSALPLAHAWIQLWYPHAGWVGYEPQSSVGFVDTHHLPIWIGADASACLPLITWQTWHGDAAPISFSEQESVTHIADNMAVRYAGSENIGGDRLLLSRGIN